MNIWDGAPWDSSSTSIAQYSTTVTNSQVDPNNGSMVSIYWSNSPVPVTPGQQYFLQVFTNVPVQLINYVPGDAYPGGALYVGCNPYQPSEQNTNWVFTEYAADPPSAMPEPCTVLLLGCGLVGVVGFRRKVKK